MQIAIHGDETGTERRPLLAELLGHAADAPRCARCHEDFRLQAAGGHVRVHCTGDSAEESERCAGREPARQLRGAENRGRGRVVHEFAGGRPGRWRADAPGVIELVGRAVEQILAFAEKRSLLREERGRHRQVHLGRIGLDLSEIGINRRVEGEVRAHADLDVGADLALQVGAAVERIPRIAIATHLRRAGCVGKDLETLLWTDPVDAA